MIDIKTSATITLQYDTGFSPFSAAEFSQSLQWLQDSGFAGAEICISDPRRVDAAELCKQVERLGLGISTLSTGQARTLEGLSLTDSKQEIRASAVKRIKDQVNLAGKINSAAVTIGLLRGLGTAGNSTQELNWLADGMKECAEFAERNEIRLLLEPINRYETILLNTVQATLDFIDKIDNPPCVGILYDIFHANIEEENIAGSIESMGKRLFHVHVADSNRWLPGMGHIDFAPIMASLIKIGFKDYMSLETLNCPDQATVIAQAGTRLKKCLGCLGK